MQGSSIFKDQIMNEYNKRKESRPFKSDTACFLQHNIRI